MIARVNVETEAEPQSFLVETRLIEDDNIRKAVEYAAAATDRAGKKSFGPRLEVVHGQLIQQGYEVNEALRSAEIGRKDVSTAYVQTIV